jgi:hypothetical protein
MLTDTPVEGVGPWLGFQRARWHRKHLEEMNSARVRSVLVAFSGDPVSKSQWSIRGLDAMVQALKEMQRDQPFFPYVSLLLEGSSNSETDLTTEKGIDGLYGALHTFFYRVPSSLRLEIPVPGGAPGSLGNVAVLGSPSGFSNWNSATIDGLRRRFQADFGRPLVVAGVEEWRAKAPNLDAYVSLDPTTGLQVVASDRITTATICPGFDSRRLGPKGFSRPRLEGVAYRTDWNRLAKERADWIILNSWNDFEEATEVAPSRQYRDREQTLTRIGLAVLLVGDSEYRARVVKLDAAPVLAPKGVHRVEMTVENLGKRTWSRDQVAAVYQVKRGDENATPEVRLSLPRDVPAGIRVPLAAGVPTAKPNGDPLDPGDYHLVVKMVFTPAAGAAAVEPVNLLDLPLKVGPPERPQVTVLQSDVPETLMAGATYKARVRLRNDTDQAFSRGQCFATYRWRQFGVAAGAPGESLKSPLPRDLAPGEAADIDVSVKAAGPEGQPLELWSPENTQGYLLEWGLTAADGTFLGGSTPELSHWEPAEMVKADLGIDFTRSMAQARGPIKQVLQADSTTDVNILVENRGPTTWRSGAVELGYHWYYWDGTEMSWSDSVHPRAPIALLSGDLAPGSPAVMARFKLKAPPFGGQYWLVIDGYSDGEWASLSGATRSGELYVTSVAVQGGPFVPQSLTSVVDLDGVSSETDTLNGDFDGLGNTFAAELMPPEAVRYNDLYPCGYFGLAVGSGVDSSRQVSFQYPGKSDGTLNFVTCRGQRLQIDAKRPTALHLAIASVKDAEVDFTLHYLNGGERRVHVPISAWNAPPRFGEHPMLSMPYRHGPAGMVPTPAFINHYELRSENQSVITAVTLPSNPDVRVMAITAESW